ncbi:MAG TPA: hypothetical protein VKH62_09690 [Candidatus Binatia bacterium]|nr:hypothetical protein [Candidatus Binatia bacterium]
MGISRRMAAMAGVLMLSLTTASAARSESVDDKIKSLEQELTQLKEQQIELKKEATAAAAAMPSFSYRPGNGVLIEAADKSWSFRHSFEAHMRYNFLEGRDQVGRSQGELEGRRFRPEFYLCINNCLWEIDWRLDLDGFGGNTDLQRGVIWLHGENVNPWLPTLEFGMDTTNAGPASRSRQGSGSIGAQAEYDLFTANQGFNTGAASSGASLIWDDRSLSGIGIPGRIGRFQVGMASFAEIGDGNQVNTDRKDFNAYLSVQPFSQLKNKWIRGLLFEYGAWFCNADNRALANGCSRYRVRDNARGNGRTTLFDTGANSIGDGLHIQHGPGMVWSIGPYTLRAMTVFQRSEDRGGGITNDTTAPIVPTSVGPGQKKGRVWLIGHDLFLWSPKGFLTGSANTAGSVLVGTHFERTDISCGDSNRACLQTNSSGASVAINGGQFHRSRILLREWDLWYFIAPRMSIGGSVLWYDASNLRVGRNQACHNLGICSNGNGRDGKGGDWIDLFFNWRYTF